MKKKYVDRDGLFYLIFLMSLTIKNQNETIDELKTRIEQLETHAILDSNEE